MNKLASVASLSFLLSANEQCTPVWKEFLPLGNLIQLLLHLANLSGDIGDAHGNHCEHSVLKGTSWECLGHPNCRVKLDLS